MDYYTVAAVVTFVFIPIVWIYLRISKNDNYWKKKGIPYQPRQNVFAFLKMFYTKSLHDIELDLYREYGRIYGRFEVSRPVMIIADPDIVKDILVKDFHIFNYRRDMLTGDKYFDKMVVNVRGEDWKRIRTIITPVFTSKRMRQLSHIVNECTKSVLETFEKYSAKNEPVDCKGIFGAFTMDVIASSAFATKINSHNDPNNIFIRKVKEAFLSLTLFQLLVFFVLPPWITVTFGLGKNKVLEFFKDVIHDVIKKRQGSGERYDDLLQLLLDAQKDGQNENKAKEVVEDETDRFGSITNNGTITNKKYKSMTEDEIIAQCIIFFVVGYETTASTLAHMAYCLALNPECQEKLIKEVDEAFEKHKGMNYDVVRDMKYLDCFVSEVLRMYPSLTRTERTATEDYTLRNLDIIIEKGTIVGFPIQAMHLDPEFFPNPKTFDPERFYDENSTHPQYAYLPFGAGPRNCLGMRFALMEIKLCMCNVLKHFRFKKAETTKVPLEFAKRQGLLSVTELPLLVEKRL